MNIKSLLFGSTAALVAATGARAADIAVAEPVEYVRVCDAYGAGYFYIPGTETCMRISGYVRTDVKGGKNIEARKNDQLKRDTYAGLVRAAVRLHTATETELGTLRSYIAMRSEWKGGAENGSPHDDASLRYAYIELGGLRVGLDETIFAHWTGNYGTVINDGVINPASTRTAAVSYTFNAGNGFSAVFGLEQGISDEDKVGFRYDNGTWEERELSQSINKYVPNVVAGVKFAQGWGAVSAVAAYDASYEEWAGKLRLDVNVTDQLSLWAMGGYKSMKDYYNVDASGNNGDVEGGYRQINSVYGDWGGSWAAWAGGQYRFTEQTSFNVQVAYEAAKTFASSVNVSHEIVPGLSITPELSYTSWDDKYGYSYTNGTKQAVSLKGKDAFQGMVRLQRSF